MAVGYSGPGTLHPVTGIRLGIARAGIPKPDRRDLVIIECAAGTRAAAVFTKNRFAAAPVLLCREHLARSMPRVLVINTGFANAATGAPGLEDARRVCASLAPFAGCRTDEVLPFSTGVIGERLPVERIVAGLDACLASLDANAWAEAAHGIMTTDTVAKGVSRQVDVGGSIVTITGIAKGAGMIRPDMATMLAFIATDAVVAPDVLQGALDAAVALSFNRITVDGDTSTNDSCLLLATGRAGNAELRERESRDYGVFAAALREVCAELAWMIVRDAEGATRFVTVTVTGAASDADCAEVAFTVAHSPLVKTALFAGDPNWGRIVAAVGRAPVAGIDPALVTLDLNGVRVVTGGGIDPGYTEARGAEAMRAEEIVIRIGLGAGPGHATVWTSDLSHDYVRINAEYRS